VIIERKVEHQITITNLDISRCRAVKDALSDMGVITPAKFSKSVLVLEWEEYGSITDREE
jgi:hypothetical protein